MGFTANSIGPAEMEKLSEQMANAIGFPHSQTPVWERLLAGELRSRLGR